MTVAEPQTLSREIFPLLKQRLGSAAVVRQNEPLSKRTTLRVGGPADIYVEPGDENDLARVLQLCRSNSIPWMMLGRGSNLLVRDGGIRGVVICLAAPQFLEIRVEGERVICGGGARLRSVAFEAKKASLTNLEFMEGIPGNIGGALRMNAGAMGGAMFQVVESVRMMDSEGNISKKTAAEIPVEYRNCPMLKTHIALRAVLLGRSAPRGEIDRKMGECSQKRWNSQPQAPSAGCIFKNSATVPTGRLVQELGLKGTRRGGAVISEVHGNFIVNEGNATAQEIIELIELVREKARTLRGIELHTEVQIVGED
jgi:UDP-N-acetylenolpyruvoylglucosamine reductase